mmetsp:Transcript_24507/g.45696  ORF Transcript_24507/g.45696 Transcript_24507/m.45696 type:complete len:91 (-) Transcript_24507:8-280(-)
MRYFLSTNKGAEVSTMKKDDLHHVYKISIVVGSETSLNLEQLYVTMVKMDPFACTIEKMVVDIKMQILVLGNYDAVECSILSLVTSQAGP